MRIGITGGTGFLGRQLGARLAARGDELVVFTRSPDEAASPARARAVAWHPIQEPAPADALRGLDAVVHLLGEPVLGRWTEAKRARIRDSRVLGTRHLVEGLEACSERPPVLIAGSATGYYGDTGETTVTEESPPGRGFLAEVGVEPGEEARRAGPLGLRAAPRRGIRARPVP